MASKLDKVDPQKAWQPARDLKWNLRWAAHLFRRAAFGFPLVSEQNDSFGTLQASLSQGMDKTVDQLLTGGNDQSDYNQLLDSLGEQLSKKVATQFGGNNAAKLQGWWLYRMVTTPHPLLERLTLFWHDHFATSMAKVTRASLMLQQNLLLRKHALGKFPAMLQDISQDPAMLIYLDSNSNIKGRPNENYAREVMELFSLGVGNYTEHDIRAAARAFTGWHTAGGKYIFSADHHDNGSKTILGETGNWNGDDVVRILLKQPAAAMFLVRKMFKEFISEHEEPPAALLRPLADRFRKSGYDIKDCISTIFRSQLFYSEHAYRNRVKSPVEYVIGLARAFDLQGDVEVLARAMEGQGQSLFMPPNVKGWDGGTQWLNSATLLARHNLAAKMVTGRVGLQGFGTASVLKKSDKIDANKQVNYLLELLLQGDATPQARLKLIELCKQASPANRIQKTAHAILMMPEYQLA